MPSTAIIFFELSISSRSLGTMHSHLVQLPCALAPRYSYEHNCAIAESIPFPILGCIMASYSKHISSDITITSIPDEINSIIYIIRAFGARIYTIQNIDIQPPCKSTIDIYSTKRTTLRSAVRGDNGYYNIGRDEVTKVAGCDFSLICVSLSSGYFSFTHYAMTMVYTPKYTMWSTILKTPRALQLLWLRQQRDKEINCWH